MSTLKMMDYKNRNRSYYTQEHKIFRDSVRRFMEKEAVPYFEQWEKDRLVPRSFWKKLGENGFLCPWVDEKYGGYEY